MLDEKWKLRLPAELLTEEKNFIKFILLFLFFFPFLSQFSTYTFRLKFNNICENIKSADLNLSPLDGIVRNNYRRASLFSFHCFQATISYSNKFTKKKEKNLLEATLSTNNACTRLIPNWLHLVYQEAGVKERRDR